MSSSIRRPDPDELLKAIRKEESRTKGGNLKIFMGMSAGVGKTYAMLEEAQQRHMEGVDVVVGIVNTHGRKETAGLLEGLEVLPQKILSYKDTQLEEVDLDAILSRKPQLVLVDELPHTNVPGSRHYKRWQDIIEILDAGIDVYTTLNVQHIESRKEMIEKITGVQIRETVPDSIIERASQIKLIDISPPELLKRLKEGKVYLGPQSAIAAKHFFQEDCLMALREIALRLAAEKVDHDLHDLMATTERTKSWKPRDKILVAFNHSPMSQNLIRSARRISFAQDAQLFAVYVETGKNLDVEERAQLTKNMALARELAVEVITTADTDIGAALNMLVKNKNITQIIIGRPAKSLWREYFLGTTLVDKILRENPDVDILVSSLGLEDSVKVSPLHKLKVGASPTAYFRALLVVLALTVVNHFLLPYVGPTPVGFIYLGGVLFLGLFADAGPTIFGALLSGFLWSFVFSFPPGSTQSSTNIAFYIILLFTGIVSGVFITRIRQRELLLRNREENTQALYEIVRSIATYQTQEEVFKAVTTRIDALLNGTTNIILKNLENGLDFSKAEGIAEKEQAVANWVYLNGKTAGWSTDTLSGVNNIYIPLQSFKETVGVLTFQPKSPKQSLLFEEQNILYTAGQQLAHYIARQFSEVRARKTEYAQQIEKVQRNILDSISKEFRNPLLDIEEAAQEIKSETTIPRGKTLGNSIKLIEDSSKSLRHTFDNILAMSQLNSGFIKVQKKPIGLHTLISVCLNHIKKSLKEHKFEVDTPAVIIEVPLDFSLMELALSNLLFNAAAHTPIGGRIRIQGGRGEGCVWISVIDEGPGVPPEIADRIFDKFYRGPEAGSSGIGLGLAIVKTVVELHGGRAELVEHGGKGAEFRIYLPIDS